MADERFSLMEAWKKIEPSVDELIEARLRQMLPHYVEDALNKQRKDVGDELVRILMEKAFQSGK